MKVIDIKRPTVLLVNEGSLTTEISSPQNVYDKNTGELIDIFIAPTLILTEKGEGDPEYNLPIDPKMFTEDRYKSFNQFTYSLGKMARLAELNLDALIDVIGLYLQVYPLQDILSRNRGCKNLEQYDIAKNFNKLTFGQLRNILSCIIKTDTELHKISDLDTGEKRSNYTTVYNNYIEDRDKYTHGILFFHYPDFNPILRIMTPDGQSQYVKYEKDVFTHNLRTHNYLTSILNEIREIIQKKINA